MKSYSPAPTDELLKSETKGTGSTASDVAAFLDAVAVGIAFVGADGKIFNPNAVFCGMLDGTSQSICSSNLFDLIERHDLTDLRSALQKCIECATEPEPIKLRFHRHCGRTVWSKVTLKKLSAPVDDRPTILMTVVDVSSDERIGELLPQSEEKFRSLVNLSSDWYWEQDENFRFTGLTQTLQKLAGISVTSHIGKARWEMPVHGVSDAQMEEHKRCLERHEPFRDFIYGRMTETGEMTWLAVDGEPVFDDDGTFKGYRGTGRNITEKRLAADRLRSSEARLRAIVETAVDAIVTIDQRGRINSFNAAAEKLFGYAKSEVEGRNVSMLMPDKIARDHDAYIERHVTSSKRTMKTGREVEGLRKDGSTVPLDVSMTKWRDEDGKLNFTGIMRDITERKRHEEHIELLMCEVNHRAKNLLTVVESIVRQTARTSEPEDFVQSLGHRLQGLSRCQDIIIDGGWKSVSLVDLIISQSAHLGDEVRNRLQFVGEEVIVTPSAAQGIGLALHELLTNALKYGALSNTTGTVTISWKLHECNDGDRFVLSWTEQGGPTVQEPEKKGFGHTVITRLIRYTVKGNIDLRFEEDGLSWELDAPAPEITHFRQSDFSQPDAPTIRGADNVKYLESA